MDLLKARERTWWIRDELTAPNGSNRIEQEQIGQERIGRIERIGQDWTIGLDKNRSNRGELDGTGRTGTDLTETGSVRNELDVNGDAGLLLIWIIACRLFVMDFSKPFSGSYVAGERLLS